MTVSRVPQWGSALLAVAVLAGCEGGESKSAPRPATGVPKEVAETVGRLDRATRARDWDTVCEELFTAGARERAGGERCAELLGESGADVRRPRIEVVAIALRGERADVRVRTRAAGQATIEETLALAREGGRWRIDALGG